MDAIGPLQLRIMQHIWKHGPATVHDLHGAVNRHVGGAPLAYTTVLSVMRTLSRRGLLSQTRGGRSHVFAALLDEATYKRAVVQQISKTLFADDMDGLVRFLRERAGDHAAQPSTQLAVAQG